MLAGDSEEASEGVLDPVQVAEATGKVLETPVETEDQPALASESGVC